MMSGMPRLRLDHSDARFTYSTRLVVRFDDVNLGGHLGNDRLVSLLGEARSRFLHDLGVPEEGGTGPDGAPTPGVIMVDLAVTYRREVGLRDELRFDLGLDDLTRVGGDVLYRVVREADDAVVATAKTGIVFFDYAQRRVVSAPEAFAAAAARLPLDRRSGEIGDGRGGGGLGGGDEDEGGDGADSGDEGRGAA